MYLVWATLEYWLLSILPPWVASLITLNSGVIVYTTFFQKLKDQDSQNTCMNKITEYL